MERECNIYNVLYCYYENGNKAYKEIPVWRYTEEDARIDCIRQFTLDYGSLFVEIVRIKQV
jgi:hypothetical protein